MKLVIIMKQDYSFLQYEQMAKEQLCNLLRKVPFLSDIEQLPNVQRTMPGDFGYAVHFDVQYPPVSLCVEVKPRGERRFAEMYVEMLSRRAPDVYCIFSAPYITEQTAEILKNAGIGYMDLSGNCYIASAPLFISIQGMPNRFIAYQQDKNYFSRSASAASTILRTMLNEPNNEWQIQELHELTGKSLGSVSNVKRFLIDHGWAEGNRSGFRLCGIGELLRTWASAYHENEDRLRRFYSLDSVAELEHRIQKWNAAHMGHATLGGFGAAARYAPTVRYHKTSVYVESQDFSEFIQDLELKEVASGENVNVILPHDGTPLLFSQTVNGDLITSPVQTILDLLSGIGRGEEAANAIIRKEYKENE